MVMSLGTDSKPSPSWDSNCDPIDDGIHVPRGGPIHDRIITKVKSFVDSFIYTKKIDFDF